MSVPAIMAAKLDFFDAVTIVGASDEADDDVPADSAAEMELLPEGADAPGILEGIFVDKAGRISVSLAERREEGEEVAVVVVERAAVFEFRVFGVVGIVCVSVSVVVICVTAI